jgi:aryl sulfotransferase
VTGRPQRIHHYVGPAYDSARWDAFRPRPGDVIVATPSKCGTTWTQMLCALLVHQSPELPLPLTRLSRWLDRHTDPIESLIAEFEAQPYRRIVKTHTPLDGLPYYEQCAYVVCGRDPRDAFLSLLDHMANVSEQSIADTKRRLGIELAFDLQGLLRDPDATFALWMTVGEQPWMRDGVIMGSVLDMVHSYWAWRRLPNLHFLHYADLVADLEAEMRRLSAFLRIPVDEARWPGLVRAARFDAMKERADENAPGAHLGEWKSATDFFREGRMQAWRSGALSAESLALYDKLVAERYEPAFRQWLEAGRAGADPTIA